MLASGHASLSCHIAGRHLQYFCLVPFKRLLFLWAFWDLGIEGEILCIEIKVVNQEIVPSGVWCLRRVCDDVA